MTRIALSALLLLTACGQSGTKVAALQYGGESYPIRETPGGWIIVDGSNEISCATPTQQDCFLSLRRYLESRDRPAPAS